MDLSLHSQKLCQIETRRLLMMMGMIASFIIFIQFLSLPYGNILLSLFPAGKVPLLGKSSFKNGDPSPNFKMVSSFNNSNSSNLSVSHGMGRNAEAPNTGEETKLSNKTTGKDENPTDGVTSDKVLEQDEDVEMDDEYSLEKVMGVNKNSSSENITNPHNDSAKEKAMGPERNSPLEEVPNSEKNSLEKVMSLNNNSSFKNIENPYNGSVKEKAMRPERSPPFEQVNQEKNVSSENFQKDDTGLALDKDATRDTGSVSPPPAIPPVVSQNNLTSSRALDGHSSASIISVNPSMPSVGKQAADLVPKVEDSELLRSSPTTSINNPTMSSNPAKKGGWEMPQTSVTSISDMSLLLRQNRASPSSVRPQWFSPRDQEIQYAKSQIENAPILKRNRELYAPLYLNVSTFKRSYELMEQILKVYIYKEGAKPIFHQPTLKGIYASEGWFMKQMEGNKHFVVKRPGEAHLFYLPFGSRNLEETLYVPNSHIHRNLVEYLKNYVDLIAAKYPYWNRTGGADHFLVACHDWAPSETKHHMHHCIRALCNADVHEGFTLGKDVSLPETNVRSGKDPLKYLGGKSPSQRQILAFFAGSMHGYLRPILLKYWENKDPDMKIYGRMGRGSKSKMNYIQHMKNSKYCICAKGYEVNSPRVVEAIFYECVPVIISDNYVPPFFEVLNWEAFAVFIPEKDIPNLKNILLSIPYEKYLKLQMSVRKVQQHFLWHTKPVKYDIFHMILHSIWYNRVFELNPK